MRDINMDLMNLIELIDVDSIDLSDDDQNIITLSNKEGLIELANDYPVFWYKGAKKDLFYVIGINWIALYIQEREKVKK